jgi:hypothetical protein
VNFIDGAQLPAKACLSYVFVLQFIFILNPKQLVGKVLRGRALIEANI